MSGPDVKLGDYEFSVKKFATWVPVHEVVEPTVITRRVRLRWWIADRWDRRPRVHLGPCNHDDCC